MGNFNRTNEKYKEISCMKKLRWISNIAALAGFVLLFGAAGGMDYAAASGSAAAPSTTWILMIGAVLMGMGIYGKRKDF